MAMWNISEEENTFDKKVDIFSKPERSMGSGSDTIKQSINLFRQADTILSFPDNRLKQAVRQRNRFKQKTSSSPGQLVVDLDASSFFLERVVPGVEGMLTEKVGIDGLISALNVPSEIKAIRCSFQSRIHMVAEGAKQSDEDYFEAIDAIGKCQSVERLTIQGNLFWHHLRRLCQSVQTSKVGNLELGLSFVDDIVMTTISKMVATNHNLKHLTFIRETSATASLKFVLAESILEYLFNNPNDEIETTHEYDVFSQECNIACYAYAYERQNKVRLNEIATLLRPLSGTGARQLPLNTSLNPIEAD